MTSYFTPISKYMLRVPLQPYSLIERYDDIESDIEAIKNDKLLCEQLLVASENIYNTLVNKDFSTLPKKKQRNLITSLGNYINRAATRTTPFGLFAGVALLNIKDEEISTPSRINNKKNSRIDAEWLFKLIKKIEAEHFFDLKFKMNTAAYRKGNRLYLPYNLDGKSVEINVNYTKPLMLIEKLCAKDHVSFQRILHVLKEEYVNRDINDLVDYVKTLVAKEFIISEVRPPICNSNLLTYTINKLGEVPYLYEVYGKPLSEVQSLICKYNDASIGEGSEIYLTIQKKLRAILSFPNQKHLQVDTELKVDGSYINESDIENINDCITLFMKFASEMEDSEGYKSSFEEYRLKFIEKFGIYVEVPISEVLDEVSGIGALKTYSKPKNKFLQSITTVTEDHSQLKRFFMDKYLAAVENKHPIVITDEEINKLKLKVDEERLPSSLELNFIIRKDEKSENLFYLGPNMGSSAAGKTFGRFSYLNHEFSEVLEEIGSELKEKEIDQVELSFIPSNVRMANVTSVNSPSEYNLSMFTNSYNPQSELSLDNILVGCDNDKLYLKNKQNGRLLNISGMNMLNLSLSSNIIRLLSDITLNQNLEWGNTPWGVYYKEFIHIPEIRYKNIILSNEKWSLQNLRGQFEGTPKIKQFISEFEKFKNAYLVPDKVYLQFADNRILLDLSRDTDLNLLYKNLFKFPSTILEKAESGNPVITLGEDSFSAEAVIPFILKKEYRDKKIKELAINGSLYHQVSYPPFQEWLFLKLYGPEDRQGELISYLNYFILNQLDGRAYDKFFYMRYNDPKPHIRLRFRSEHPDTLQFIYGKLNEYIVELQKMNIVYEVTINTYFPEINRYGGPTLINEAENVFYQDSLVVMKLLEIMNKSDYSKEQIGVMSLLHYLNDFGLTFENQLSYLGLNLRNNDAYKKQFKDEKFDFINELDSYNNWEKASRRNDLKQIIEVLDCRSDSINVYKKHINRSSEITSDFINIIGSVIHLHFNRLFEIDRAFEDKLYVYAYQTLFGQRVRRKMVHLQEI
ncbi:lantibiotic dehydratase [Gracilibacillus saliphilus]|uniref:lantibiotic dehydratase n=1 Tax=Gracilibacillus saliphilus TaxID=543890 RepID=UPI0013D26BEA|nr:lantibiotic dehydratase [Gracilibacillus saliphilus]